MGTKFADLWKSSALIQGVLALATTGAVIYLAIVDKPIPDILIGIVMTCIGFYFGTKNRLEHT